MLGIIQFSSWERPVYRAIYPGDPDYSKQFNRWLRGGKARPAAVWTSVAGAGTLVCYGVTSESDYQAKYVAETEAENMPDKLI